MPKKQFRENLPAGFSPASPPNKYHNRKVEIDGLKFDSMWEARRWQELRLLESAGVIRDLQRQVRFEVIPKTETERACFYVADFVYAEGSCLVIEDAKSPATRANREYINKRKAVKWRYPQYEFREIVK